MSSAPSVALLLGTLFLSRIFYLLVLHPLASYPGPLLAKLTSFWRFFSFLRGSQRLVDLQLHERYGSFVRDGPDSLLISDIEAFKAIYGFTNTIQKGDFYIVPSNGKPEDPNVFSARTEVLHREAKKKLVSAALTPKHVAQYELSITDNIQTYIAKLHGEIKASGGKLDLTSGIERLLFDIVLEVTYGSSMGLVSEGCDRPGIIASKKKMLPLTIGPGLVPWLARLMAAPAVGSFLRKPRFDENGRPKGLSAVGVWVRQIFGPAVQGDLDLRPCVLRNLLEIDASDSRKMSQDMTRYECFNFVFAGTASTSAGLIAVLYEIATHPEWQSQLYMDLRNFPEDVYPSSAQLSKLSTLQAVMKESLRLHPPFSGPFERVIGPGGETIISNTRPLPQGTRVWSSQYVICRSEAVFGKDVEVFRPERWLQSSPEQVRRMDDVFCVFGRGSRGCIGKDLAWMVMEKTVAAILRKWHLTSAPGGLKGRDVFEMQYHELEVTFTPRI